MTYRTLDEWSVPSGSYRLRELLDQGVSIELYVEYMDNNCDWQEFDDIDVPYIALRDRLADISKHRKR